MRLEVGAGKLVGLLSPHLGDGFFGELGWVCHVGPDHLVGGIVGIVGWGEGWWSTSHEESKNAPPHR